MMAILCSLSVEHFKTIYQSSQRLLFHFNTIFI
jgi:hypothetical protein